MSEHTTDWLIKQLGRDKLGEKGEEIVKIDCGPVGEHYHVSGDETYRVTDTDSIYCEVYTRESDFPYGVYLDDFTVHTRGMKCDIGTHRFIEPGHPPSFEDFIHCY